MTSTQSLGRAASLLLTLHLLAAPSPVKADGYVRSNRKELNRDHALRSSDLAHAPSHYALSGVRPEESQYHTLESHSRDSRTSDAMLHALRRRSTFEGGHELSQTGQLTALRARGGSTAGAAPEARAAIERPVETHATDLPSPVRSAETRIRLDPVSAHASAKRSHHHHHHHTR